MTNELINYKEASLKTSHAARIATLEEQLYKNSTENYTRMTQGKIRIAQDDFELHMALLEDARKKADILFELLAYGTLIIQ